MTFLTICAAAFLIFIIGRNDGSPLAATALRSSQKSTWWIVVILLVSVVAVPLAGLYVVAEILARLFGESFGDPATGLSLLLAVGATVLLSLAVGVPTSITLALVGALAGTLVGVGARPDWGHVLFVLGLGALAPGLACLLAYVLRRLPLRSWVETPETVRVLGGVRVVAYTLLCIAYSVNDGQKNTFIAAVAVSIPVGAAAGNVWVQLVICALFGAGFLTGMRTSVRTLTTGVFRPTPLPILWAQLSTFTTLVSGAALGAPLSMTQALQGSVLGTGLSRGYKAVRWEVVLRVLQAWFWTLPVAGVLSFVLSVSVQFIVR